MNKNIRTTDALLLEDFDIIGLSQKFPEQEIGVNVNRIYIQIAKYNQNPKRENEIKILKKALVSASNENHLDSKYSIMTLKDVMVCFGGCLKTLPKSTFVLSFTLNTSNFY